MKTCSKCGETKPLEEFHKDKRISDGLRANCKGCIARYKKKYREENREKKKESDRKYREKNREKERERSRRWHEENRETARERSRRWYQENREAARERGRRHSLENRERAVERTKSWRKQNPERYHSQQAKRRVRKRGTLTTWDLDVSAEYRKAIANDPCSYCGRSEGVFHVDHFFPVSKGGDDRWYGLTRACESCNLSKSARCGTAFRLLRGFL